MKGSCVIAIPDEIVDHNIQAMASTLVGKFLGPRPSIDEVRQLIKQKWALKGPSNFPTKVEAISLIL